MTNQNVHRHAARSSIDPKKGETQTNGRKTVKTHLCTKQRRGSSEIEIVPSNWGGTLKQGRIWDCDCVVGGWGGGERDIWIAAQAKHTGKADAAVLTRPPIIRKCQFGPQFIFVVSDRTLPAKAIFFLP